MSEPQRSSWLLLAFQLPSDEAYLRVKVWRRLQGVGAVSFRNALYVLPANEQTLEDFEWILREIRECGGNGAVFEAELTGSSNDSAIRGHFDAARETDYLALADELKSTASGRPRAIASTTERSSLVARVRRRLREIESIDFFNANGRETVHALLEKLERLESETRQEEIMSESAAVRPPSGRVWVTRARVRVDRMASAWLIRRRIDPDARFKFVEARGYRPGAGELRFDMFEAEYTHDSDRCTFEVLLDLVPDRDMALSAIGEIVHDLDIKDGKYDRPEAAGIRQLIDGIIATTESDEERLRRSALLFDDLYQSFAAKRR